MSKLATTMLAIGLALWAGLPFVAAAQDIYKTVDENGNVVYTDQKPSEDAEPITLKELSVVEPTRIGDMQVVAAGDESADDAEVDYQLKIVSPTDEQVIWNTAYVLDVTVSVGRQLPAGAQFVYRVDGQTRATSQQLSVSIEEVWRGEHNLAVELRNADNAVLDTAGPIVFYMKQGAPQLRPNAGPG